MPRPIGLTFARLETKNWAKIRDYEMLDASIESVADRTSLTIPYSDLSVTIDARESEDGVVLWNRVEVIHCEVSESDGFEVTERIFASYLIAEIERGTHGDIRLIGHSPQYYWDSGVYEAIMARTLISPSDSHGYGMDVSGQTMILGAMTIAHAAFPDGVAPEAMLPNESTASHAVLVRMLKGYFPEESPRERIQRMLVRLGLTLHTKDGRCVMEPAGVSTGGVMVFGPERVFDTLKVTETEGYGSVTTHATWYDRVDLPSRTADYVEWDGGYYEVLGQTARMADTSNQLPASMTLDITDIDAGDEAEALSMAEFIAGVSSSMVEVECDVLVTNPLYAGDKAVVIDGRADIGTGKPVAYEGIIEEVSYAFGCDVRAHLRLANVWAREACVNTIEYYVEGDTDNCIATREVVTEYANERNGGRLEVPILRTYLFGHLTTYRPWYEVGRESEKASGRPLYVSIPEEDEHIDPSGDNPISGDTDPISAGGQTDDIIQAQSQDASDRHRVVVRLVTDHTADGLRVDGTDSAAIRGTDGLRIR